MTAQIEDTTADVEQAATEISSRLGLPVDFARVVAARDRAGVFIRVMVTPELIGRLSLPKVYRGYRVDLQRGFAS